MEEVLFHSTLISDITDHSKFMDTDFVYKAFMVLLLLLLLFVFCLFFLSYSQIDNAKQCSFALIIIVNWA